MRTTWAAATVLALSVSALAGNASATDPADGGPLGWPAIVSAVQAADRPEHRMPLSLTNMVGRTVNLPLRFVREEKDSDGKVWHLYRHEESNCVFFCWIVSARSGVRQGLSGVYGGRIVKCEVMGRNLRQFLCSLWLDAEHYAPAP